VIRYATLARDQRLRHAGRPRAVRQAGPARDQGQVGPAAGAELRDGAQDAVPPLDCARDEGRVVDVALVASPRPLPPRRAGSRSTPAGSSGRTGRTATATRAKCRRRAASARTGTCTRRWATSRCRATTHPEQRRRAAGRGGRCASAARAGGWCPRTPAMSAGPDRPRVDAGRVAIVARRAACNLSGARPASYTHLETWSAAPAGVSRVDRAGRDRTLPTIRLDRRVPRSGSTSGWASPRARKRLADVAPASSATG
jgi:hypothetical protein